MLRKEGIKRDAEVQALEDVICFVFLRWYFQPFAAKHAPEAVLKIVEKTARKMSDSARARALAEFDLPEPFAAAFRVRGRGYPARQPKGSASRVRPQHDVKAAQHGCGTTKAQVGSQGSDAP